MIDIKALKADPTPFKDSARKRGIKVDIDKLVSLDDERLKLVGQIDSGRAELNLKDKPTAEQLKKLQKTKSELEKLEAKLAKLEVEYHQVLVTVPNLVSEDTPEGKDDGDNKVLRQVGEVPKFDFKPKPHWELGEVLGVIDMERAARVAGSRFTYLKGGLAKLQFALIQYVIHQLTDPGAVASIAKPLGVDPRPFQLVIPPVLIRTEILEKMARLEPKQDRYKIEQEELYLSGSAEHALGPMHLNEILNEADLPVRYLGYSTAFRRESGSYGRDVRGILRLHQFDKLEMESFSLPESSLKEQDFLVAIQEKLMQDLELPYQVVAICTGDMGDPDARQIDIETWMPGQDQYRETHTADLMTDYQARRLQTRYKKSDGTVELVHMNDATATAGRTLIAIMENNQLADGTIRIPAVLQAYYGSDKL